MIDLDNLIQHGIQYKSFSQPKYTKLNTFLQERRSSDQNSTIEHQTQDLYWPKFKKKAESDPIKVVSNLRSKTPGEKNRVKLGKIVRSRADSKTSKCCNITPYRQKKYTRLKINSEQ